MEPFALFNLLHSLFSQNPAETPTAESAESPPLQSENTPPSANEGTEQSSSQEAVLQFLSAHEARAKRTRKP